MDQISYNLQCIMIKFPISFDKFYVRLITPEGYKPKIFPKISGLTLVFLRFLAPGNIKIKADRAWYTVQEEGIEVSQAHQLLPAS